MICPVCDTQNDDTYRFCIKCGHALPEPSAPPLAQPVPPYQPAPELGHPIIPYPVTPRKPSDPVAQIALIFGITAITGGALTVLGWLFPWFSIGGLGDLLGGGSSHGILNLGSGVGSGLQVSLALLVGSIAAFSDADTILLGLLGIVMLGVFVSIPILGIQNVRSGIKAIERRIASGTKPLDRSALTEPIDGTRSRSQSVFVIMVIIFILLTVIPFGTSALGGGFYLTAIGPICSYFGAFFSRSRLSSLPATGATH
jgi:hypothetical protein